MTVQKALTKECFSAITRTNDIYKGDSPLFFMLKMPQAEYAIHEEAITDIIEEMEMTAAVASLEECVEKLNRFIKKSAFAKILSIAIFQKAGSTIRIAAFPSLTLFYRSERSDRMKSVPLQFPDTNKIFSEIMEMDITATSVMYFLFSSSYARGSLQLAFERGKFKSTLPESPLSTRFARYVSKLAEQKEVAHKRPPKRALEQVQKQPSKNAIIRLIRSDVFKYGLALIAVVFVIGHISNGRSTTDISQQNRHPQQPAPIELVSAVYPELSLQFSQAEKVPSKYLHTPLGFLKHNDALFTYQANPNILLRIDHNQEVSPVLLDAEQLGNITNAVVYTDGLIALTHTKPGIIFLDYTGRRWRLTEFANPVIEEYTDMGVFDSFIYILDAPTGQIWKLDITETNVAGTAWVQDDRIDLTSARHMTIDGAIYISFESGEIVKMIRGKRDDSFTLDPAIGSIAIGKLVANPETQSLFILDTSRNRIIELTQNGALAQQYIIPPEHPVHDLFVTPEAIAVLSDSSIYAFARKFKEPEQ